MAKQVLRGGDKLRKALDDLAKKVARGGTVEAGFIDGRTYPDAAKTPVAQVAQWNEFGTSTSPPRPFMRQTINDHQDGWGKALATSLKATDYDVHRSLDFVGEIIDDQIRTSIREGSFAPISERTLEARLASSKRTGTLKSVNMETASKPLVDTGLMLGSVSHEVSDD